MKAQKQINHSDPEKIIDLSTAPTRTKEALQIGCS